MIADTRFVIVAGMARNLGKTTLICNIIEHNSDKEIIALKFIILKEGGYQHRHHAHILKYEIFEEQNVDLQKDTSRMLVSGAKRAYLLVTREAYVPEALADFLSRIEGDKYIIAESASLRYYIQPHKFIILGKDTDSNKKAYMQELIPLADYRIEDIFGKPITANMYKVFE